MMIGRVRSAIAGLGGLKEEEYWKTILAIQEDLEGETDYDKPILMMARAIKDQLGKTLSFEVARNLYRHLSRRKEAYYSARYQSEPGLRVPTSPLVNAIVALARSERDVKGVQGIVNYNFDDLLDEKLRRDKVKCVTVKSGHDKIPVGYLPCYHVHGVLSSKSFFDRRGYQQQGSTGNFVFSEDEYHEEYSDPYKWSNMTQMSLLGKYTGLFIGLSMEDPNIRRLIDATHRQYPDIPNYSILTRRTPLTRCADSKRTVLRNLFEDVETSSFAKIGVKIIWVDNYEQIPRAVSRICQASIA